jgi:hypothetical protein
VVKKAPIQITHDLIMNPIEKKQHNVLTVYQNGQNYLFTVCDLKNIIETALCNSPHFFADPLPIKNPYNNLVFNKASLYKIYFFMKSNMFIMPTIFHQYFLCEFHLTKFYNENSVLIRKIHTKKSLKNESLKKKEQTILHMLSCNDWTNKWRIDRSFPKERLCEIMEPYLKLYYSGLYSLDLIERVQATEELRYGLIEFYRFNRKFGIKYIGANKKTSYFDEAPKLKRRNYALNYERAHLEIFDDLTSVPNILSREEENQMELELRDEELSFLAYQNDTNEFANIFDSDNEVGDEYDSES